MSRSGPRYSEAEARAAVEASLSVAGALRKLGMCTTGGNRLTLAKWLAIWGISTDHFDPDAARIHRPVRIPLAEILVERSSYHRGHLKRRLYEEGLKERRCELCGQGEQWHGRYMALILDHVNGTSDDNRLENLRIVCPNCAATLDTHCGRKNTLTREPRECLFCGAEFTPNYESHRYCSRICGQRVGHPGGRPAVRKVERPSYDDLLEELDATNFCVVARHYGVSDNAIRKWLEQYEREWALERAAAKRATA